MQQFLNHFFKLKENNTRIRTELLAGLTTFLTMVYIAVVNPSILSKTGMPFDSVFVATCLVAIIGCLLMGFLSNYPMAVAPSMGLNVFFTYIVVLKLGYQWQQALAAVFIAGVIFLILTLLGIRQRLVQSIPKCIGIGTTAGIGLFIGMVGLEHAGFIVHHTNALPTLGDFTWLPVCSTILGLIVITLMSIYRIPGGIVASIILLSAIAVFMGETHYQGFFSLPPSMAPTFLDLSFRSLFSAQGEMIIFTFVLVALFDSTGSLIGVLRQIDPEVKRSKRLSRALASDSTATIFGALFGTSTTAAYIESSAGIKAGGRTGLTSIVVAILFALVLFFSPMTSMIPDYGTAPALICIAYLMSRHLKHVDWHLLSDVIPSLVTVIAIPVTFSIANGIGAGFISYTVIKTLSFKFKDLNLAVIIVSLLFLAYFIFHF